MTSRDWLVTAAKRWGASNVGPLDSPQVSASNFVLALRREKVEPQEGFFVELANALRLPFISPDELMQSSELALVLLTVTHELPGRLKPGNRGLKIS